MVLKQGLCPICSTPSHLRCSNCAGDVFYCSKEHQREDWKEHKKQCDPIKIVSNPQNKEQSIIIATLDIKKGEVFLKEKPFICGPRVHDSFHIGQTKMPNMFPVCLGCLRIVKGCYKCSKCSWPVCSPACEIEKFHADFECKIFAEHSIPPVTMDNIQDYVSVCLLRILLLRDLKPKVWAQCLQMKGFWEGRELKYLSPDMALQHSLTEAFLRRCRIEVEPQVLDRVTRIYYGNRRGIKAGPAMYMGYFPDYRLGSYLYLKNSLALESCTPSSCWITYSLKKGTEIHGRAHFDIPKGSPITASGVDLLLTTMVRQMIYQQMNCRCSCDRCKDPTELGTYYQAVKCKKCTEGYLLPKEPLDLATNWVCDKKECAFSCSGETANRKMMAEFEKDCKDSNQMKLHYMSLQGMSKELYLPASLEGIIAKHEGETVHRNHSALLHLKFDMLEKTERVIGPNYVPNSRSDESFITQLVTPEFRRKLITRAKECLAVLDIIVPGSTRYKGNFLYHMQLHMLHLLTLEVNRKDLKEEDKEGLRKDFEELLAVRKEGLLILDFEVEGSTEKERAKDLKKEPPQFDKIRRVLEISI